MQQLALIDEAKKLTQESRSKPARLSVVKRLLREPLLHFLLIGAGLFVAYHFTQPARDPSPSSKEIRLSLDELAQMTVLFQSQWRRDPTPEEFKRMVEQRVQSEVLYREALGMGLDKNDEIVRRRMAQKMEFLAEDVAASREPKSEELRSWFEKNTALFAQPARLSFRHLYFSPDRRGGQARDDALKALARIAGQAEDTKLTESLADPFMFQDYYRDRAPDYLGKEFGPQFAQAVEKLPAGSWQGPIESGYGWHLVFVDSVIPGRVPAFEEVESEVKTAWLGEQKTRAWEKAYEEMRAKYTVLLPVPSGKTLTNLSAAPPAKQIPDLAGEGL